MLANRFRPPARLSRHITDQTAPLRSRNCRPITALQDHRTRIGIEIRHGAKQQGFAGARWSPDGDTLALRQGEGCRSEDRCPEIANLEQRQGRKSGSFPRDLSLEPKLIYRCPSTPLSRATLGQFVPGSVTRGWP